MMAVSHESSVVGLVLMSILGFCLLMMVLLNILGLNLLWLRITMIMFDYDIPMGPEIYDLNVTLAQVPNLILFACHLLAWGSECHLCQLIINI